MFFITASVVTLTMFTSGGIAYGQEETVQSNPASNQTMSEGFFIETVPFSGKLLSGTILPLFDFDLTHYKMMVMRM